jgi:CDP-diacylglycerol--glycerol-3-phosphate 3-phosphatidyltransferase
MRLAAKNEKKISSLKLKFMKKIPLLLIAFRFFLAPVIFLLAFYLRDNSRAIILVLMYLGLFSDIIDGIIARNLNVATAKLRRLDSQADMIFWLSIGFSSWVLAPEVILRNLFPITAILIMEGLCYAVSILKFGKETCTHAFLSKLWGISLLVGFTFLIGFDNSGIPFAIAIIMGIISHLDRIAITLILPKWTHDIPSCYHAFLIRKGKTFRKNKLLN